MIEHDARALGFSDRPLGTMAVRVEPREAPAGKVPDEVVLRWEEISVHVSDVQEQTDGSFDGRVSGFSPDGSSVGARIAIADRLNFRASHVFTFSGFADAPPARARRAEIPPKKTDEKFRSRIAPEIPTAKETGRPGHHLLALGAAVLAFGIAVGYTIGRSSEPAVSVAHRTGPVRPALKIDYELRAREQHSSGPRRD